MIGWFMVLSFALGFVLTWLYVVRSVTRTVDPVDAQHRFGSHGDGTHARPRRGHSGDTEEIVVIDPEDAPEPEVEREPRGARRRSTVVPQVVEFEDDTEEFYER